MENEPDQSYSYQEGYDGQSYYQEGGYEGYDQSYSEYNNGSEIEQQALAVQDGADGAVVHAAGGATIGEQGHVHHHATFIDGEYFDDGWLSQQLRQSKAVRELSLQELNGRQNNRRWKRTQQSRPVTDGVWGVKARGDGEDADGVDFVQMRLKLMRESKMQVLHNRLVHYTERAGMQESVAALKKFDVKWEPPADSPLYQQYLKRKQSMERRQKGFVPPPPPPPPDEAPGNGQKRSLLQRLCCCCERKKEKIVGADVDGNKTVEGEQETTGSSEAEGGAEGGAKGSGDSRVTERVDIVFESEGKLGVVWDTKTPGFVKEVKGQALIVGLSVGDKAAAIDGEEIPEEALMDAKSFKEYKKGKMDTRPCTLTVLRFILRTATAPAEGEAGGEGEAEAAESNTEDATAQDAPVDGQEQETGKQAAEEGEDDAGGKKRRWGRKKKGKRPEKKSDETTTEAETDRGADNAEAETEAETEDTGSGKEKIKRKKKGGFLGRKTKGKKQAGDDVEDDNGTSAPGADEDECA